MPIDGTYLPPELTDHFEAQGYRVTMASKFPEVVGTLAGNGRHPVALSDLPPELQANNGLKLRQSGVWLDPAGMLFKGDCFIYIQPQDAYEAQVAEGRDLWLLQDREDVPDGQAAAMNDLIASGAKGAGRSPEDVGFVQVHRGGRLSDSVGRPG